MDSGNILIRSKWELEYRPHVILSKKLYLILTIRSSGQDHLTGL